MAIANELDTAIAAAEGAGQFALAGQLRALVERHAAANTVSGEHNGRRWEASRPQMTPAAVWPNQRTHTWEGTPGVAIEFDERGGLEVADPWTGARFLLLDALETDGSTSFCEALHRLADAMESADFFAGAAQNGRAGVVRE